VRGGVLVGNSRTARVISLRPPPPLPPPQGYRPDAPSSLAPPAPPPASEVADDPLVPPRTPDRTAPPPCAVAPPAVVVADNLDTPTVAGRPLAEVDEVAGTVAADVWPGNVGLNMTGGVAVRYAGEGSAGTRSMPDPRLYASVNRLLSCAAASMQVTTSVMFSRSPAGRHCASGVGEGNLL